jgi:hypothetical protein
MRASHHVVRLEPPDSAKLGEHGFASFLGRFVIRQRVLEYLHDQGVERSMVQT